MTRLALTLGDPASIGPEILLKALADPAALPAADLVVVGSRILLERAHEALSKRSSVPLADPRSFEILDVPLGSESQPGHGDATTGAASFAYLKTALARTVAGEFQGVVTAPIAKSLWQAAGHDFPGQTEVCARAAGCRRFGMLFVARSPHTGWTLRVLLATTHIPLKAVPAALTQELLARKLDLLTECLAVDFGLRAPRIAVSGLNPHSGEAGQLGCEERDLILPWLEGERRQRPNLDLVGPVPPDTLWVGPGKAWYADANASGAADGYLALYHDQGLIPVKLMAFDRAINTTIGLPFVRTSPDHGTAFDIAGRGIADATSFQGAISLAAELVAQRAKRATAVAAPR